MTDVGDDDSGADGRRLTAPLVLESVVNSRIM